MANRLSQPFTNELSHYLAETRKYPVLDAETEQRLVRRWHKKRDRKALDQLAGSHLRLVIKMARSFRGYGLPLDDLIAEGNLGLMQAIERFDPSRGFRLSTYAIWWIRAQLQDFVLRSSSLVRMGTTAAQKRLFFNLRRLAAEHDDIGGGDLSPEVVQSIADTLKVQKSEVIEMSRRMGGKDSSLNERVDLDGDAERQDFLMDDSPDPEELLGEQDELEKRRDLLAAALGELTPRERQILVDRRLKDEPLTLEDLGTHFGVSRERVRQIEARALIKLGKAMRREETRPAA
jgi:RNA polymerase sigma-32 factor